MISSAELIKLGDALGAGPPPVNAGPITAARAAR
jgi:hypothetical protein